MSESTPLSGQAIGLPATVSALFPLYLQAVDAATAPDATDDACSVWCGRMAEIEVAIINAPSETPQDVARKVLVLSALGEAAEIDGPNAPALFAHLRALAGLPV